MKKTTRTGFELITTAIVLGIAGNLLVVAEPLGLGISLWAILFAIGMTAVMKRWRPDLWSSNSIALIFALLFFSSMFAIYDSPQLLGLDLVAIFLILAALVLPALSYKITNSGVIHFIYAGFASALSSVLGPIAVVSSDIEWDTVPKSGLLKQSFSVMRGLALAVPAVLLIGGLLMAADASFQTFVVDTFLFDPDEFIKHATFTSLISWGVLGYSRSMIFGAGPTQEKNSETKNSTANVSAGEERPVQPFSVTEHTTEEPVEKKGSKGVDEENDCSKQEAKEEKKEHKPYLMIPGWMRIGLVEVSVVLGLINLLFLAFVIFQIPYLFGGMELVQQTPDFKLAEYARRGVGELISVSFLILPMLLGLHWLLRKDEKINETVFRILATVQIGLLFVIMVSAVQRLNLLTGSLGYGQTTFRFYSYFFLIWLSLVFVWFAMTVLRGQRMQFAYGAFWSTIFVIGVLHYVNPDEFIARRNIELMTQGRSFDATYNAGLSYDAVPVLIESMHLMSEENRQAVEKRLGYRSCWRPPVTGVRAWNWSRSTSAGLLYANKIGYLRDCPGGK